VQKILGFTQATPSTNLFLVSNKVKLIYAGNTRPPPWFIPCIKMLVLLPDIIIFTKNYYLITGDKTNPTHTVVSSKLQIPAINLPRQEKDQRNQKPHMGNEILPLICN
jgi:hypothetical protein